MLRRLITRFRLWRWDQEKGDVLALAEASYTISVAAGFKDIRLKEIVEDLRAERAQIGLNPNNPQECTKCKNRKKS